MAGMESQITIDVLIIRRKHGIRCRFQFLLGIVQQFIFHDRITNENRYNTHDEYRNDSQYKHLVLQLQIAKYFHGYPPYFQSTTSTL